MSAGRKDLLLIPAIDLLGGKVVRLFQGDMGKSTVYADDPLEMAKYFMDLGVRRLHIVDLDGARKGGAVNFPIIEKIARLDVLTVEVGGGIREMGALDGYFSAGVRLAVLGTAVAKDREFTVRALEKYPHRIILGIDARGGKVATDGWYNDSGADAVDLALQYGAYKAESVIYTDISKDGTLTGVNIEETASFASRSPFPVIASGGVSGPADLEVLRQLGHERIIGCVIGKAIYEHKIDLKAELAKACETAGDKDL